MNGLIIINKEKNFTSRDVVNIISKKLNIKKVGHTGTLDPIATGVLVICIGKYTKLVNLLTADDKEYIAAMRLGIETDTLDITGNVIKKKDFKIDEEKIKKVLNSFLGKSLQEVPIYSAVKVNGKKLYEYARNNEKVNLPTREITIKNIELLNIENNDITFKVLVSKGTYIRSLIRDIALRLNTVGTMVDLQRTKQGNFSLENAITIEEFKMGNYNLLNIENLFPDIEIIKYDNIKISKIKNGILIKKEFKQQFCLIKNIENKIIALYQEYDQDKTKAKPFIIF